MWGLMFIQTRVRIPPSTQLTFNPLLQQPLTAHRVQTLRITFLHYAASSTSYSVSMHGSCYCSGRVEVAGYYSHSLSLEKQQLIIQQNH